MSRLGKKSPIFCKPHQCPETQHSAPETIFLSILGKFTTKMPYLVFDERPGIMEIRRHLVVPGKPVLGPFLGHLPPPLDGYKENGFPPPYLHDAEPLIKNQTGHFCCIFLRIQKNQVSGHNSWILVTCRGSQVPKSHSQTLAS